MSYQVTCSVCGKIFESRIISARYCSNECRSKAGSHYRASAPSEPVEKICIVCGKTFKAKGKKQICSPECQLEHKRSFARNYRRIYPQKKKEPDEFDVENEKFWERAAEHRRFRYTDPQALERLTVSAKAIGVSYGEYVGHKDTMTEERFMSWCIQRAIEKQNRERSENERERLKVR